MKEALGIDVGGVIIDRINDNTDTSFFSDNYLNTKATPDVFEVINRMVKERFGNRVYIVSKCGNNVQNKTLNWFKHHDIYSLTGISSQNVYFCRQRHEKEPICKELGITHFIDDRIEVLSYLKSVNNKYALNPQSSEMMRYSSFLPSVNIVYSWKEFAELLL